MTFGLQLLTGITLFIVVGVDFRIGITVTCHDARVYSQRWGHADIHCDTEISSSPFSGNNANCYTIEEDTVGGVVSVMLPVLNHGGITTVCIPLLITGGSRERSAVVAN